MFVTRMNTLSFLLLLISFGDIFVIFDTDYALFLFLLCKANTLWNILMMLGSNKEQDQMTCHIQKMTSSAFFYFWSYLPFLHLNLISFHCSVTQIPYGIF